VRVLLTALAFTLALCVAAALAFAAVMLLAGPHAGLLPKLAETVVLALGWLVVLLVPAAVARLVWRLLGRPPSGSRPSP
jgi:hypothetical protein